MPAAELSYAEYRDRVNGHGPTESLADASFPVARLRDATPHLRRPFTPEAVKFKVQTQTGPKGNPNGGIIVAYIDARLVIERLNLTLPDLWQEEYGDPVDGTLTCRLTIDGVTHEDIGVMPGTHATQIKGLRSDAFKRAAVKFGIGVSLYAVPHTYMRAGSGKDKLDVRGDGDKKRVELTDNNREYLRQRYATWLEQVGEAAFGPALDHGDVPNAQGDPDEGVTAPEPVEEAPAEIERIDGEQVAKLSDLAHAYVDTGTDDDEKKKRRQKVGRLLSAEGATGQSITERISSLTPGAADKVTLKLEEWSS